MGKEDCAEHRDSEPDRSGINQKFDQLEEAIRKLPPASGNKESIEDYLDGQSQEEE
jgi:uncharacterized protein HemX